MGVGAVWEMRGETILLVVTLSDGRMRFHEPAVLALEERHEKEINEFVGTGGR